MKIILKQLINKVFQNILTVMVFVKNGMNISIKTKFIILGLVQQC